jgi:hypothetical protein
MEDLSRFQGLDDWQVVCRLLPTGWQDAARELGALRRSRGIADAELLLRVLLVHLADGCSLKETALRAAEAKWCSISSVAVHKRLMASEEWLRWLCERLWLRQAKAGLNQRYRVRAVDATTVQEQGSTGTDWRVHFVINLSNLQCDHYELTDAKGGETFRRIPIRQGDLILGDRAYGTPPGIGHVSKHHGEVLVRVNHKALPLYRRNGQLFPLVRRLSATRIGQPAEWPTVVQTPNGPVDGRLVAIRRGVQAAKRARHQLRCRARKKQKRLSREAVYAAGFVYVWTTVPRDVLDAAGVLELYRMRWQIELSFKRMKSILGLGQLPKNTGASCRAWIHGKLLVAMLIERLLEIAESFSPWGYGLDESPEPLA